MNFSMNLRMYGQNEEKQRNKIKENFHYLKNDPTQIAKEIINVNSRIESAKNGGCVIKSSIMGPQPSLQRFHELEKEVLETMQEEAKQTMSPAARSPSR